MRERLAIALGVAAILLVWTLIGSNIVGHAQRHDFLNLYTGGKLAAEGRWADLHDPVVQFEAERRMVPDLPALVPFVRPHFYAWLLQPLAWLPLGASFWTWLAVQAGLYAGWTAWAARRFGRWAIIGCAAFAPVVYGVMNGQDCVLMLWIVTGTWLLAERKREDWAGAVLALSLFKFHLLLLVPALLVLRRRWKMLAGYVGGAGLLVGWTLSLSGRAGAAGYTALLMNRDIERLSPSPEMMLNAHAVGANVGAAWVGWLLAAGAAAMLLWRARAMEPAWRWLGAGAAASLSAAPHIYGYDGSLLLVTVLHAAAQREERELRWVGIALLIPALFWMTVLPAPLKMGPAAALLVFLWALTARAAR